MSGRRWQVTRALRVLLACAVLLLPAGPPASARVWADVAGLVAVAYTAFPSDTAAAAVAVATQVSRPRQAPSDRTDAPAIPTLSAVPASPAIAARYLVLVPDIYLRNCTLLC